MLDESLLRRTIREGSLSAQPVKPAKPGNSVTCGAVFAADKTRVTQSVQFAQNTEIVQLTCARLVRLINERAIELKPAKVKADFCET